LSSSPTGPRCRAKNTTATLTMYVRVVSKQAIEEVLFCCMPSAVSLVPWEIPRRAQRGSSWCSRQRRKQRRLSRSHASSLFRILAFGVRGGGRGYQNGGPPFANLSPRLSLFSDHLRTVLAVKGSLRRAQQRRALDRSGPFRTTLLRRGKGSLRTAPLAGDHFAAILVPFFAATDTATCSREMGIPWTPYPDRGWGLSSPGSRRFRQQIAVFCIIVAALREEWDSVLARWTARARHPGAT